MSMIKWTVQQMCHSLSKYSSSLTYHVCHLIWKQLYDEMNTYQNEGGLHAMKHDVIPSYNHGIRHSNRREQSKLDQMRIKNFPITIDVIKAEYIQSIKFQALSTKHISREIDILEKVAPSTTLWDPKEPTIYKNTLYSFPWQMDHLLYNT